jgi:hypothetical protein
VKRQFPKWLAKNQISKGYAGSLLNLLSGELAEDLLGYGRIRAGLQKKWLPLGAAVAIMLTIAFVCLEIH